MHFYKFLAKVTTRQLLGDRDQDALIDSFLWKWLVSDLLAVDWAMFVFLNLLAPGRFD